MTTTASFPYRVRAEITDEVSLPSIVLTMGDGYKYRYPDGLNLPKTIWNIECPLDDRNAEANLEAFLERVGNDVPFMWQSPRDCQPRYYFIVGKVGGRYRPGGGLKKDFFVRSMQFEDANIDFGASCDKTLFYSNTYVTDYKTLFSSNYSNTYIATGTIAPAVSITGGTETTGFTISLATVQSTDTIISIKRFYTGIYTGFLNNSLTVTILANSLSVNLPFGSRMTTASFGSIAATIDLNGQLYILDINGSNTATINFP